MDPLRKKVLGRSIPKLGKNKRLKRTELFARRQRDKLWLETHIWHAKRMKMENMWGYRLAVHPTEKSYRPSHRASVHGSIIHDASYYSIIEMKGDSGVLKRVLDMSCDPNGPSPGSKRYSGGSRALETYIYKSGAYPFGLISPLTVLWKSLPLSSAAVSDLPQEEGQQQSAAASTQPSSSKRKRKGKEKAPEISSPALGAIRTVWLIAHPSAYEDVLASVKTSASAVLDAMRHENADKEVEIEVGCLNNQVNIFEIMGPKSNQVLRGALTPVSQDKRQDFKMLLIPGTPLNPERQDDRIPVILISRSLGASNSKNQGLHGWTLIVPSGWSMAFFSSLTFTGTRVGGQRERQTQAFEAGVPYFPRDLPTSTGYEAYATARAKEEKARWDRKPPAKRSNYQKLGTESPWRADWHGVLGMPKPIFEEEKEEAQETEDFVTTQREQQMDEMEVCDDTEEMWLLRGSEVSSVISGITKMFNHGAGLLQEINKLRIKCGLEPLEPSVKPDKLIKRALVSVRITFCKRGAPEDLAIIYSIDDDEARKWERVMRNTRGTHDEETEEEIQLSELEPTKSSVIGYITTGHFSLSQGQGFGIGAIPLVKYLQLQDQAEKRRTNGTSPIPPLLVKVRNRNGQQCRAAHIELLT
ncbi:hypothetical protein H0H93_011331 [Arthromyces matolae]|nr:hypothetical protein H0H93_011331 [Arthromyces matolae]